MNNKYVLLLLAAHCCAVSLWAQTTATLENISLPTAGYLDDAGSTGLFNSGNVSLHNYYDNQFLFWEGWAVSKITDNQTPGFLNQYSAITGKGFDNSANYAVGYSYGGNYIRLNNAAKGGVVNGVYITNSTYAFYSMKEGDSFAKKFGGVSGNDPDYFKLTIKKYLQGQLGVDSIDFYLADYRAANNSQDYILQDWQYVDLRSLGNVDSLAFFLSSSDNGVFGMNTPAYFCLDHLVTADMVSGAANIATTSSWSIAPNPAKDRVWVQWASNASVSAQIFDLTGRLVAQTNIAAGGQWLDCSNWAQGIYWVRIGGRSVRIVKN